MANNDWERFGEEIRRTVQNAVDSQDFNKLNQTISNTINNAVDGVARGMKQMGDAVDQNIQPGRRWNSRRPYDDPFRRKQKDGYGHPYEQSGQPFGKRQRNQYDEPYGKRQGYQSEGSYNKRQGYQSEGPYNKRQGYQSEGPYNSRHGHQSGGPYNKRQAYQYQAPFWTNRASRPVKPAPPPGLYVKAGTKKAGSITLLAAGFGFAFSIVVLMIFFYLGTTATGEYDLLARNIMKVFWGLIAAFSLIGVIGIYKLKRAGRFQKYVWKINGKEYCDIKELAANAGKSEKYVAKDVERMIKKRWFRQGHLDQQKSCLMVTDKAYRQYMDLMNQKTRQQREEEDAARKAAREQQERSGLPPEVQQVIQQGDAFIKKIHECNDAIPGEEISAKISRMEMLVNRIFDRVEQNPETVADIRRLMEYYLPTTIKLLEAYRDMDAQPVKGENIVSAKVEIEKTLDTLNTAFEKLLDDLFKDTAWDVASDVSVLHTLLAQEGLTEDDFINKN